MAAEATLSGDGSGTVSLGASAFDEAIESPIPCDVIEALLPGDDIVEIEKPGVGGGLGYRFAKRAFDLMSCAAALVILAIPMAAIAIKIKSESSGPAIYAQRRVGLGGREFFIYKFRSMYADAEARGAQWAADGDPRVTPFGKKLRRTRLDEIPQFWNVVKGDIPLRILKTRPEFSEESMVRSRFPPNLARTKERCFRRS
ncbi:sugar transferase [Gordonibacter pamelaeae]|uniref:sugar transferase n=1 Tax=Gordonibacter pamelaeae TaxID=471189 RepID=UPI002FE14C71